MDQIELEADQDTAQLITAITGAVKGAGELVAQLAGSAPPAVAPVAVAPQARPAAPAVSTSTWLILGAAALVAVVLLVRE